MPIPKPARERWILQRIEKDGGIDMLSWRVVMDYVAVTKAVAKTVVWGAQSCTLLQSDLARMTKAKLIKRDITTIPVEDWKSEVPKWHYSYTLDEAGRALLASIAGCSARLQA